MSGNSSQHAPKPDCFTLDSVNSSLPGLSLLFGNIYYQSASLATSSFSQGSLWSSKAARRAGPGGSVPKHTPRTCEEVLHAQERAVTHMLGGCHWVPALCKEHPRFLSPSTAAQHFPPYRLLALPEVRPFLSKTGFCMFFCLNLEQSHCHHRTQSRDRARTRQAKPGSRCRAGPRCMCACQLHTWSPEGTWPRLAEEHSRVCHSFCPS